MPDTATDQDLPHRQEAFARHVASGRSLTAAARLSGYAWDSARQAGSRLIRDARVAARLDAVQRFVAVGHLSAPP